MDLAIMPGDEIVVPKELREFMLDGAEETFLGKKNGANKQYRYGNLHIREYDDKFLIHTDKIDPRKDPLGHLVFDAPEVLVGLACGFFGGLQIGKLLFNNNKSKKSPLSSGIASAIISGYMGYTAIKKIKNYLE
jgi:hypothetical protein